jgi:hypothetical protein
MFIGTKLAHHGIKVGPLVASFRHASKANWNIFMRLKTLGTHTETIDGADRRTLAKMNRHFLQFKDR